MKTVTQSMTNQMEVKQSITLFWTGTCILLRKKCKKTSGPGVAMQAQVLTRDQNEMASKLTVGEFVVFDKSDDEVKPIWLGRIMSNPEW